MSVKILCITRKYPPEVGGMENFCYNVFNGIKAKNKETKIVALGKKQINLLWFFPYAIIYTLFNAYKYDVLFVGDSLLCFLGFLSKIFYKKTKVYINVYGLDITYKNSIYQFYLKLFLKNSANCFSNQ